MTPAPLLAAPAVVQLHVAAALVALLAGSTVLLLRKGTAGHRRLGWVFVAAMAATAASSAFITGHGRYSAIHLLSLLTAASLPYAVVARRRGDIAGHRSAMIGLFAGLAIAGAFTLLPGRVMHLTVFGTEAARPR